MLLVPRKVTPPEPPAPLEPFQGVAPASLTPELAETQANLLRREREICVVLRASNGYSNRRIAEVTGLSLDAVLRHLRHARHRGEYDAAALQLRTIVAGRVTARLAELTKKGGGATQKTLIDIAAGLGYLKTHQSVKADVTGRVTHLVVRVEEPSGGVIDITPGNMVGAPRAPLALDVATD